MGQTGGWVRGRFLVWVTWLVASAAAVACDTPVYRYAMYRWPAAPYEVYCFHQGEIDGAGKQLQEAVRAAGEMEAPANIVFLPVDLTKDKELTGVPPDIKRAWLEQASPEVPSYIVSSPVGAHLHKGQLRAEQLPAITDSPARQQIGNLLEQGAAGVYILLEGADAEANAQAKSIVQELVQDVGEGKIPLYSMPPAGGFPGEGAGDEEPSEDGIDPYKLSIGFLSITREDPKEQWLVKCLLPLEPDLAASQEPIVYMIYGRGRVLFSCLGKGIYRDNLIQDIEFVTGACSCTVKEQNPGVDLLMCYNWDAVAEKLSQQYGTEEGSPYEFGGDALFPELIIPSDEAMGEPVAQSDSPAAGSETTASETPAGDPPSTAGADARSDIAGNVPGATPDAASGAAEAATPTTSSDSPADTAGAQEESTEATSQADPAASGAQQVALAESPAVSSAPQAEADGAVRSLFWIGAGLVGALLLLLGATFVVLRPK